MNHIESLKKELEEEAATTRKFIKILPEDKYDWKPHPKSMSIRSLVEHLATIPTWVQTAIETDELDFAKTPYSPKEFKNNAELEAIYDKSLAMARASLQKLKDADLDKMWTMRNGEVIYSKRTKDEVIRMSFSQMVHHRAQLGVFLRLLNVPIPGSYGPSADEHKM